MKFYLKNSWDYPLAGVNFVEIINDQRKYTDDLTLKKAMELAENVKKNMWYIQGKISDSGEVGILVSSDNYEIY